MLKYIILFFTFIPFSGLMSQTPAEKEIEKVILEIFDGMRAGDSARVSENILHSATMFSAYRDNDGSSRLRPGSLSGWLTAIATPREEILDERIWDVTVEVDDNLATAWMSYALYIGEQYSHCGVDAFQLFHNGEKWVVFHVTDTRRAECDIPDNIKSGK